MRIGAPLAEERDEAAEEEIPRAEPTRRASRRLCPINQDRAGLLRQPGNFWGNSLNREDFLKHYHRRSNVESTFSAMKRKFGGSVRSKLPAAQLNEVLLKCLAHNLSVLVHSIHELGIQPEFWKGAAQ